MLYNNKFRKIAARTKSLSPSIVELQWKIVGMDCISCVQKIKHCLKSIDAVDSVQIVFATGRLKITTLANAKPLRSIIENQLKSLGFELYYQNNDAKTASRKTKHRIPKAEIISLAAFAALIILSFLIHFYYPYWGQYTFILTALIGWLPIAKKTFSLMRAGTFFSIETLTSLSAIGALFIGAAEEASMVLFLFRIGELLEDIATNKAKKGITALSSLMPEEATKLVDNMRIIVPSHSLQVGDVIEATSGDRLPADVILLNPFALIDESALTGEAIPVEYQKGNKIMAGSLIIDHTVQLRIVSETGDNAIDRIIHLIEQAEEKKASVERFIERFSNYYTPGIMLFSTLVATIPPLFFDGEWLTWIYRGLTLLLIGCPCALVISTPASITSALSNAARQGVLIKGGSILETLAHTKIMAFDKTGTLTLGLPQITDTISDGISEKDLLQKAAAVEVGSSHPIAKAIIDLAEKRYGKIEEARNRQVIAGIGVKGKIGKTQVSLSSPAKATEWLAKISPVWLERIKTLEDQAKTCVLVIINHKIVGLIALQDRLRDEAKRAIKQLHALGITPIMLTGDNSRTAKNLAHKLHIDYRAELLPMDKLKEIEKFTAVETTVMIGDGINDSPAIKAATVGIAMGTGTDIALESADAALTKNNLLSLPKLIRLARATNYNIRQNITLALGIKMLFLITTLLGMTGLWIAVLADSGTTALVTANALRLLRVKK